MQFYWISGSHPCWRVMLAFAVKGIEYDSIRLDNSKKEQKSDSYLAINPKGTVPALVDDEIVICESLAILYYLDQRFPQTPLFGKNTVEASLIWQALLDAENTLFPHFKTLAQIVFRGQLDKREADFLDALKHIEPALQGIDAQHKNANYMHGDDMSALDLSMYPALQWLKRALRKSNRTEAISLCDLLEDSQFLVNWEKRIQAISGYENTYPPHWRT